MKMVLNTVLKVAVARELEPRSKLKALSNVLKWKDFFLNDLRFRIARYYLVKKIYRDEIFYLESLCDAGNSGTRQAARHQQRLATSDRSGGGARKQHRRRPRPLAAASDRKTTPETGRCVAQVCINPQCHLFNAIRSRYKHRGRTQVIKGWGWL